MLFANREHPLDIPKVLRATPSFLQSLEPAMRQSVKSIRVKVVKTPAAPSEQKSELKPRVRDSLLLDDFFIKKV